MGIVAFFKINEIIDKIKNNNFIGKLGIHIHRKSQNTSEWEIVDELKDSLNEESLNRVDIINLGGGLPSLYASSNTQVFDYISSKLKDAAKRWMDEKGIEADNWTRKILGRSLH